MGDTAALRPALDAREAGDLTSASAHCLQALRDDPQNVAALSLLGSIMVDSGAAQLAIALLERAQSLDADDPDVLIALADAFDAAGDLAAAEPIFLRALQIAPQSAPAWTTWGRALLFAGRTSESVEALREAVSVSPEFAEAHLALSSALFAAGVPDEAEAEYDTALQLSPEHAARTVTMAHVFSARGQSERARAVLEHGTAMRPADPELRFLLDALIGNEAYERAPAEFVVQHFDRFAPTFESCLRDGLGYDVPAELVALIRETRGDLPANLDILDIGCGTGLCGPLLRPLARRLVGVDLSAGMLAQATRRDVYDELIRGDIVDAMRAAPEAYDLVIATDVLIYFGALDELLAAAAGTLRRRGMLAVSIETHEGSGYRLGPAGRWSHGTAELLHAASAAGLTQLATGPSQIRTEHGEPVHGQLAVFAKPDGPQ